MLSPTCVNDYGSEVHLCRYTNKAIAAEDVVLVGALIPGVKTQYTVSRIDGMAAHKQSVIWFHEAEANCNTCQRLDRVAHKKGIGGFLYGRCTSEAKQLEAHPYKDQFRGDVMIFHPNDPMGMPCYESRWDANSDSTDHTPNHLES